MSARKNSLLTAPYDANGNLREYTGYGSTEWRPNEPFAATFFYKTWERGRSAVRIVWEDVNGITYPMFMKDMDALLTGGHLSTDEALEGGTVVHGEWWVVKRGANYGIALVEA